MLVSPKRGGAQRSRRDIDLDVIGGVEQAAVPDHLYRGLLEGVVAERVAEIGRITRIDRETVRIGVGQSKTGDPTPVWSDELLQVGVGEDVVLEGHALDLQRLPAIGIDQAGASIGNHERLIDRGVVGIDVTVGLVGAVRQAFLDVAGGNPVSERTRLGAVDIRLIPRIAQRVHEADDLGDGALGADREQISGFENPEGGKAHRLAAGRLDVVGLVFLGDEVAGSGRLVSGPRVPHGGRGVEQVAGMDGGRRGVSADGVEGCLIPAPGDRPIRVFRGGRAGDRCCVAAVDERKRRRRQHDNQECASCETPAV